MKTGLTSISFREKTIERITEITKKANLEVIEWGSDVHCPPDNSDAIKHAADQTLKAGIKVSSYGSYYRLGITPLSEFESYCKAAKGLGTDVIRIWAYNKEPQVVTESEYSMCIDQAKAISDIAKKFGITVCFEYHRGTLTLNAKGAKKLIEDIGRANIRLYWQPNPDISHREKCAELEAVLPYVVNIHCFYWLKPNIRRPLTEGFDEWINYLTIAKKGNVRNILMEFVMNDTDSQLLEDADTLCKLVELCN